MRPPSELVLASARGLAQAIRSRTVSAEEVVAAHLERIDMVNGALNAVVQRADDVALLEARRADESVANRATLGPLHGVPFTVKDWIETAGLVCAGTDPRRRRHVPARDATVVARMRQAGAILLGKTNVGPENPVYGRTRNPYDTRRTPTGSSSGEAAIIAAGGSPLGLGSDSGGSIRQPAHACGIAGLKPTTGRVPLTGHLPRISAMNDPRTVMGPLARHVDDLALVLPILAGVDWIDASTVPMPLGSPADVVIRDLRVAVYTRYDGAEPTEETDATTRRAAATLADLGASVAEAIPERIVETFDITRDYWRRPESESWEAWIPDGRVFLSSDAVERHLFQWDRFRRALAVFMGRYDVVLTPAAEEPASIHGEPEGGIPYTLPYSLTGYPCAVVRAGTSPEGMPIGVQVVARPWRDDVALAVGRVLERAGGGYRRPPARGSGYDL